MIKALPKTIFEIKVNCWTKRTKKEKTKALEWIHRLLRELEYEQTNWSDEFSGKDK